MWKWLKRKTVPKKKYDAVCEELEKLRKPRPKKWKVVFKDSRADLVVDAYEYTVRYEKHCFRDSSDNLIHCFPFSDLIIGVKLYKEGEK